MVSLVTFPSTFKTSSEVKIPDAYANLSDECSRLCGRLPASAVVEPWQWQGQALQLVPGSSDGAALGQCGKF